MVPWQPKKVLQSKCMEMYAILTHATMTSNATQGLATVIVPLIKQQPYHNKHSHKYRNH
jgi:hypothetical protein